MAELTLPSSILSTKDHFTLHPSLLDSVLQVSIGLAFINQKPRTLNPEPLLPFALESMEVFGRCPSNPWVLIQSRKGTPGQVSQKLDVDLCDENGNICVRMRGLERRNYIETMPENFGESNISQRAIPSNQDRYEQMTFEEVWQKQALPKASPVQIKTLICFLSSTKNQRTFRKEIKALDPQTKVIFISQNSHYEKHSRCHYSISETDKDTYEKAFKCIRKDHDEIDAILYLWALEDSRCIQDPSSIIYILQTMAMAKLNSKRFLLAGPFENTLERCYVESWIGFERSLGLAFPKTNVAVVFYETGMHSWVKKLWGELQADNVRSVLYQSGKRHICQVKPTSLKEGEKCPFKQGDTYLITGGCGGLGLLFAEHLSKKYAANLILTGRSALTPEKQSRIQAVEKTGSSVFYLQADVCDSNSMKKGLKIAKKRFGPIHGVLHAAGIEGTRVIFEKDIESFRNVLDPKIKGTLTLDEVLSEEPLDFICYFSSSSAMLGDFGSCDYAIGNRFQMAYTDYRNELQTQGKRLGKAIVINWPLWKDGGIGRDHGEQIQLYLKSSGQRFLESQEGLALFGDLLSQEKTQHLVLVGKPDRVHQFLGLSQESSVPYTSMTASVVSKGRRYEMRRLSVEECVIWDLKELVSQLVKINRDKLDVLANLADFGFDSLSLAAFARTLTEHYGVEITPALFFGHSTLERLTGHFLTQHETLIQMFYQEDETPPVKVASVSSAPVKPKRTRPVHPRFSLRVGRTQLDEPIAIIGMSGRFPKARDIESMWKILSEGQDAVEEIPDDRFDWQKMYGDPNQDPYKTNCKWSGCIPGVAEFDPLFFELSPREAKMMDPRQRHLLQESWKALEDASYGAKHVKTHKIGMFVGVEEGDYDRLANEGEVTLNHNGILASRLAYFLNLEGPVMAINTACSSSLVAAHQACLSLRNQECDTALAAGVSLTLSPGSFIGMSQAGMLSSNGKCYTFDKRANGMVPGEAVAVVVLKRLSQAEADGDSVHAVIRGSGINYDGKANGITAPNGVAQTELLKNVYEQAKINPEDISYIVTHGTGTKLGDPVEINALYDTFKGATKKQNYCALTSTKTNFGHTFAASGLVSMISLVESLRHEIIPASLHCEEENDYIHWKESPFYVNRHNQPWPKRSGKGRIGAVSAFGMSGTNAHVVLQEYDLAAEILSSLPPYFVLALSAKTEEVLQEQVNNMATFLEKREGQKEDLYRMSYTLLEGRHHFQYRCAIVIEDKEDAIYTWKQMEKEDRPNFFQGKVTREFRSQKAMEKIIGDLLKESASLENPQRYQETLYVLADLYCQGYTIDWRRLYGNTAPRRMSLPAYPFVKERYWIQRNADRGLGIAEKGKELHPLVHENTSDFEEQRFSSTFTGEEFFLADHVIQDQKLLPGVGYLEMARAAVEEVVGPTEKDEKVVQLKNIVWTRSLAVNQGRKEVHIGLFPEDNGEIQYEIYTTHPGDGKSKIRNLKSEIKSIVHSQGAVTFASLEKISPLDIKALQKNCQKNRLNAEQCYEVYKAMGFDYGPSFQGINEMYVGEGEVLAQLSLPFSVADTHDQFVLHPSMIDSALQASMGLAFSHQESGTHKKEYLPFALQSLEIFRPCPCYA